MLEPHNRLKKLDLRVVNAVTRTVDRARGVKNAVEIHAGERLP